MPKKDLKTAAFVAFSLALFVFSLLAALYVLIRTAAIEGAEPADSDSARYYFREPSPGADPYIESVPSFSDYLDGPIVGAGDPAKGRPDAPVAIVLFSDFACPYCHEQEAAVARIMDEYQDRVMAVWKDFPEADPSSLSYQAAIAGRCAQAQGLFWEFHDRLYAAGGARAEDLSAVAAAAGADQRQFADCLASDHPRRLVEDNIEEGYALGISGVPFMYVNEQEIFGKAGYEDLKRLIDIELNSQ